MFSLQLSTCVWRLNHFISSHKHYNMWGPDKAQRYAYRLPYKGTGWGGLKNKGKWVLVSSFDLWVSVVFSFLTWRSEVVVDPLFKYPSYSVIILFCCRQWRASVKQFLASFPLTFQWKAASAVLEAWLEGFWESRRWGGCRRLRN